MSDISQVVIFITDELPDLQGCKSDFSQESSDVEIGFLYVHIYTYIKQCCFFSLYNNNSPSELLYCILELHVVGLLGSLLPPAGVLADGLCPPQHTQVPGDHRGVRPRGGQGQRPYGD